MKEYEVPTAEFIKFESEIIGSGTQNASGCNCSFWQVTNDMDAGQEGCTAKSAHATENNAGLSAPQYVALFG